MVKTPVVGVGITLLITNDCVQQMMPLAIGVARVQFQSACRSPKVSELHTENPPEKELTFIAALTKGIPRDHDSPWTNQLSLNDMPTKFEIDTGAAVTIISTKAYKAIGSPTPLFY